MRQSRNQYVSKAIVILTVILLSFNSIQTAAATNTLNPNELTNADQSLTISADTTLTINSNEKTTIQGSIIITGTVDTKPKLEIINNGELTIKTTIQCTIANLTIQNKGTLTIQDQNINLSGNATLNIINTGTLTIDNAGINVYGGVVYINNDGTLNANNWNLKDQYDGTSFTNNKDAVLTNTSFTANGAFGLHNIANNGNLQLTNCVFDANYGGTINFNSQYGTLTIDGSGFSASGASHGKTSSISILTGQATWKSSIIESNSASIIYSDYGAENTMQGCTFKGIGNYNTNGVETMTDCTITNLNNYNNVGTASFINCKLLDINNYNNGGNIKFTNCNVTNIHNLANNGNLEITNTQFTSNANMNILNSKSISADNWMLKTNRDTTKITLTNQANLTFTTSFIENVDVQTLTSLGATPTVFNQASGGTITVTNVGLIQTVAKEAPSQQSLLIGVIIATIVIIIVAVIVLKKRRTRTLNNRTTITPEG